MVELANLIHVRGIIKAKLTRFSTFLSRQDVTIDEVRARLENFEPLLGEFEKIQVDIELAQPDQTVEREEFEDQYFRCISMAKARLRADSLVGESGNSEAEVNNAASGPIAIGVASNGLHLPNMNVPSFDGNYKNWLSFYSTFKSLIHEDASLSNIQKFHYLKSALRGDASRSVDALAITQENYDIAFNALVKRYHDERLIIKTHINAIFEFPTVASGDTQSMRALIDTIQVNLQVLAVLGLPTDQWDALIIHIILYKVDSDTAVQWEGYNKTSVPELKDLLEFLSDRCRQVESLQYAHKALQQVSCIPSRHERSGRGEAFNLNRNKCLLCKHPHALYFCDKFRKLSVEERYRECRKFNLCINCLRSNHHVNNCKSDGCKYCKRRHHTLLHCDSDNSRTPTCHFSQGTYGDTHTFLATAVIGLTGPDNNTIKARAVLDAGSQTSFIRSDICKRIKAKVLDIKHSVAGIGEITRSIKNLASVKMDSLSGAFSTSLSCLVVDTITGSVPSIDYDPGRFDIPSGVKLADEQFYRSGAIDILLGADIFWDVLCGGRIKREGQPVLQETVFGWVVSGPLCHKNTVTYGLASSPSLAMRNVKQLGCEADEHADAQNVILNGIYVDDVLTGHNDKDHLIKVRDNTVNILGKGCFPLAKWASNCQELIPGNDGSYGSCREIHFDKTLDIKTLGLIWNSQYDILKYSINSSIAATTTITGRQILSDISKLPRLELCAAVFLAQLVDGVLSGLKLSFCSVKLYSDSTIVLAWLKLDYNRLKTFMANRISKILTYGAMKQKAIHIELVGSLTAEAFLNAVRRFISRKGHVSKFYSDNGTQFVGADRQLRALFQQQEFNDQLNDYCLGKQIKWHFIAPRAPHQGGLWESHIKLVKTHLKRVVGETKLTFEEMYTLLTGVEACINSRPITPMSHDPNDLNSLCPSHFLIGSVLTAPTEPDLMDISVNRLTRWQHIERMRQHFWRRWQQDYLHTMQQRSKWKQPSDNVKMGTLVVIREDNLPPLQWLLGRVVGVHPGADGRARVVTLKTRKGLIKRATTNICRLPDD